MPRKKRGDSFNEMATPNERQMSAFAQQREARRAADLTRHETAKRRIGRGGLFNTIGNPSGQVGIDADWRRSRVGGEAVTTKKGETRAVRRGAGIGKRKKK